MTCQVRILVSKGESISGEAMFSWQDATQFEDGLRRPHVYSGMPRDSRAFRRECCMRFL